MRICACVTSITLRRSKSRFETHRCLTRTWPNRKGKCLTRTSIQVPNPDFPLSVFRVPNPDLAKILVRNPDLGKSLGGGNA